MTNASLRTFGLLLIVILMLSPGCRRSPEVTPQITAGETGGSFLSSSPDRFLTTYRGIDMDSFDLNQDGKYDLRFTVNRNFSPGGIAFAQTSVLPLHESVALATVGFPDQYRYCEQTDSTGMYHSYAYYNSYSNYTCPPGAVKDSLIHDNPWLTALALAQGATIDTLLTWQNQNLVLAMEDRTSSGLDFDIRLTRIVFNEFIGQGDIFIACKIEENSGMGLGWIKVEVHDYADLKIKSMGYRKF